MLPSDIFNKKVCISPLNWGMGHVSRCISIINKLIEQKNSVYFAGSAPQSNVINNYFGNKINYLELKEYPFKFSNKGNFGLDILLNYRKLSQHLKYENDQLSKWYKNYQFDIIIADHRYGFYNKNSYSIFLTHQTFLPLPYYLNYINVFHRNKLKKFNKIWVPDNFDRKLTGKLSKPLKKIKTDYIGPISRFELYKTSEYSEYKNHTLIVISGPDPYAKLFFEEQFELHSNSKNTLFILPRKLNSKFEGTSQSIIYSTNWRTVDQLFLDAKKIISRSGYSTIMDNYFLKKECEYYPTKGQLEQEYLSKIIS